MTEAGEAPAGAPERLHRLRRGLALAAVVTATVAGALGAVAVFSLDRELSVGTVRISVSPFHDGALDIYVPVVDWGARFPAVRAPARLEIDVRAVDRQAVARLASGAELDVKDVRDQARGAIAAYVRLLLATMLITAVAAGGMVALAVRGGASPRLRVTLGVAAATALAATAATAITLPPRGTIDRPQYYAFGPDIPRALEAVESVRRSTKALDQELDAQLVGLAKLVTAPAERRSVTGAPRLTIASDLHNYSLALPILERAARGGPVLFPGDLTDRGTPLEAALTRRIVGTGDPFIFVSGNHDSDQLVRRLARDGAIVLTEDGRLNRDGTRGPAVVKVNGLRVAGYGDPFERRVADRFADRFEKEPGPERQAAFAGWLTGLLGRVDVVMVHDPLLAQTALAELERDPPTEPLVLVAGHTHKPSITRLGPVTVLNGGSIGAGGTGNIGEGTPFGLAVLAYDTKPRFQPLAADLVQIDPGSGSSTARRERLDSPPPAGRGF